MGTGLTLLLVVIAVAAGVLWYARRSERRPKRSEVEASGGTFDTPAGRSGRGGRNRDDDRYDNDSASDGGGGDGGGGGD